MTSTTRNQTGERIVSSRAGAVGALIAAAAFIFGIALAVTSLSEYTDGDATAAESVEFLVDNKPVTKPQRIDKYGRVDATLTDLEPGQLRLVQHALHHLQTLHRLRPS